MTDKLTWKFEVLKKVPIDLIFSLLVAIHSLMGAEMARGAAMLMSSGSLVTESDAGSELRLSFVAGSVVILSFVAGSGCSSTGSVVGLSSVFSWGNMTCLLLNILTMWLHWWTAASAPSSTGVPFTMPGGEENENLSK